MMKENFTFFVPLEFSKAKNAAGNPEMRIKGVASTSEEDSDEEVLEPEGFDMSRFLKIGYLNWNHKAGTDPTAIVGQPTKAFAKNGKMHIEGFLYPDSKKAKEIWDLAATLEKNSPDRRLGYSIEGKVLARDPMNAKRITRALITGCAITPTPKNTGTLLEVMKGHVDSESLSGLEFDLHKSEDPNGGTIELIIDITDENGVRRTVDKNLNIKVFKTMDMGELQITKPESVEEKNRKKMKPLVSDDIFKTKNFSKSEIYTKIFSTFTDDIVKARDIYSLIEQIQNKLTPGMANISSEAVNKAKQLLDLATEVVSNKDDVNKSVDCDSDMLKKKKEEYADALKKAESIQAEIASMGETNGTMEKAADTTAKKEEPAAAAAEVSKAVNDDIVKGLGDTLSKAFDDKVDHLSQQIKALGILIVEKDERYAELEKSMGDVVKFQDAFGKRIGMIEKTPLPRKSVDSAATFRERFAKSENGEAISGGALIKDTFSISRQRTELVDRIFEVSGLAKGEKVDQDLVKAMEYIEQTGSLGSTHKEVNHFLGKLEASGIKIIE